ncbi:MAG: N-acetylglucosamine-6-phosphate deacetylase [Marmoricola sp.]|nr:N-acetylglucosamine-6-phosphate deacetylase [Marmoricola sp.]
MSDAASAVVGGAVVTPAGIVEGHALVVRGGQVEGLVREGSVPESMDRFDVGGRLVTPGLIDVHMHGALGHVFGDPLASAHSTIMRYLLSNGVTSVQPTLSTTTPQILDEQLERLPSRVARRGEARMLRAHLEGPFLSPAERGAHDPRLLLTPTRSRVDHLLEHRELIGMVTLAPEIDGGLDLVERLVSSGIRVAIGHSAAEADVFRAARDLGAAHLTHLWSGMSNVHRVGPWRHPGMIEMSLASDDMTAEIIADGAHLPAPLLEIARRCLGDRLCVVSDSTQGAGLPEGTQFRDGDVVCVVRDSVCMVVGEDSFAGSSTQINRMLDLLHEDLGWPLHELVAMATVAPARAAGVSERKGSLAPGFDADISVFDPRFECFAAMVAGAWEFGPFTKEMSHE